jgi:hypothetical protein
MTVIPSYCNLLLSAIALPHDHSVLCYRLGTVVYSGHHLASRLLGEGQDYQLANLFRQVMKQILSGLLSPSSEIRVHVVRHR